MNPEHLSELLRSEPLPAATEARERAIAAGRELALESEAGGAPRRPPRRQALLVAAATLAALVVALTPPGGAVAGWVDGLFATGEPGGPPTNPPAPSADMRPAKDAYVLAAGRAPDGVRYELFLEYRKRVVTGPPLREGGRSQEGEGHCILFAWPDVPAPSWARGGLSGSCPPGRFPDEYLLKDLTRNGAAARPYSFLNPPRHTREYMYAYGFALPDVTRIRVLYPTADGELADAPVDLIEPSAEAHERIGSSRPLDVFVAFLPYAAGRLEDPLPQELPSLPSRPYHVVAYDKSGNILSRVERTNLANAPLGETWRPRPDCVERHARQARPGEAPSPHAGPPETCYEKVPAQLEEPRAP